MSHQRRRTLRVLRNPISVTLVVVVTITTGWMLYFGGTSISAQAPPDANSLPALDSAAQTGPLAGWTVDHSGDDATTLDMVDGQLNDRALELNVTRYTAGDVTLSSPRVDVEPGETYWFKAFTTTDSDFTLLARKYHADGSTTLEQLPNPLERPGNAAFTVSDAFNSNATATAAEYVFRLASTCTVQIEGAYLEAADDVELPPAQATAPTLVPNPELAGSQLGAPDSWSPYDSGVSTVQSGRSQDPDGSFLWTRVVNYQSGEAKWQYEPVPVTVDRYLEFGTTYTPEREVDVVAEFELADGQREFAHLATLPPAGEWTTIREGFQVPAGAKTAMEASRTRRSTRPVCTSPSAGMTWRKRSSTAHPNKT